MPHPPTTFSPVSSFSLPRAPLPLPLPTQLHCPTKISVATASAPIKQRRLRRPELRGTGSGANRFSPLLFSVVVQGRRTARHSLKMMNPNPILPCFSPVDLLLACLRLSWFGEAGDFSRVYCREAGDVSRSIQSRC